MKVTHYERARFLVESESGSSPYLVDLLENKLNGQCDCQNFRIEIQPVWEQGRIPPVKRCKHIRRARRHIAAKVRCACRHKRNQHLTNRQSESAVNRVLVGIRDIEIQAKENPQRFATIEREKIDFVRINPVSDKRRQEEIFYHALVAEWKILNPYCQVCALLGRIPRPTRDPHHRRGRAGNLLVAVETWTPVCRDCHNFIENNKAWAKANGLIEQWGVQV